MCMCVCVCVCVCFLRTNKCIIVSFIAFCCGFRLISFSSTSDYWIFIDNWEHLKSNVLKSIGILMTNIWMASGASGQVNFQIYIYIYIYIRNINVSQHLRNILYHLYMYKTFKYIHNIMLFPYQLLPIKLQEVSHKPKSHLQLTNYFVFDLWARYLSKSFLHSSNVNSIIYFHL